MSTVLDAELMNPADWATDAMARFAQGEKRREEAEKRREEAEAKRDGNEQSREDAEDARKQAENARNTAESKRQEAERERDQKVEDLQTRVESGEFNGASFKPVLTAEGSSLTVSFENDRELPNPDPVTIDIEAQVDDQTGEPSVDVTCTSDVNPTVSLSFHNLKGDKGDAGESELTFMETQEFKEEVQNAWN